MPATAVAPARKFLSADALLRLSEIGVTFELIGDGQVMELEVSKESSRVAGQVFYYLESYSRAGHPVWVLPEGTSYRCFPADAEQTRRADVSLIALARMPIETYQDEGHCTTAPDLVVEVISPNDLAYEVNGKRDEWLAAGVREVWIVYPGTNTVHVHRADGSYAFLRPADVLAAPDLLPGFAVPVADLFRLPSGPAAPRTPAP